MMENCETCGGTGGVHPFDNGMSNGPVTCRHCVGTGKMPPFTKVDLTGLGRAGVRRFENGEIEFMLNDVHHGARMRTILEPETAVSLVQALEADPLREWKADAERENNLQGIVLWSSGEIGMRYHDWMWIVGKTPMVAVDAAARIRLVKALSACAAPPDPNAATKRRIDDNLRGIFS